MTRARVSAWSAFVALLLAFACRASAPSAAPADWSAITTELQQRVDVDQALRREMSSAAEMDQALLERLVATDADNTAWMKELVERHGWPTIEHVGKEGARNAWLLVQHADHDVDFQECCLALLRAAVAEQQAGGKELAFLEDRVAMHRGRPQRYGTQFVKAPDGKGFVPYTLEDEARVDEYRTSVGLDSLAEYTRRINGAH